MRIDDRDKIDILKERVSKRNSPGQIMNSIIDIFGDASNAPRPGSYCSFIYTAKTPRLLYDRHPLIAVLGLEPWGFRGFNFHLHSHRNYNWEEVQSVFCSINGSEIAYLKSLRYRILIQNS